MRMIESSDINMSKPLYESVPPVVRVVKREHHKRTTDEYLRGHELSMLHLLLEKYRDEARKILKEKYAQ